MLRARNSSLNGLMRMPMNGGSVSFLHSVGDFGRRGFGVTVFFIVRTIAITVFEIDAKIFNWFRLQLFDDPAIDGMGEPGALLLFARALGFFFRSGISSVASSNDQAIQSQPGKSRARANVTKSGAN